MFCANNILTEDLAMRESQFDELCGLRQIAVSWQISYSFLFSCLDTNNFLSIIYPNTPLM
jgi:hypothetical protein